MKGDSAFGRQTAATPTDARVTDTELVAAACAGDEQAWGAIVARYQRLVWSMTGTFGFDPAQRHDVAQNVWLKLTINLESLRDPERLGAWLATTTKREAVDTWRRSASVVPMGDAIEGALGPVWDDTRHITDRSDHAALRAAFATLPAHMQELLALLVADPALPYRTIAEVLGRPVGSIGPSRRRALRRLRRAYVAVAAPFGGRRGAQRPST